MTYQKPNYIIHCIYAGAFLLSVFFYISYQVWNRVQLNNEIKSRNEEHRIHEVAQILKEKKQQEKISSCLRVASYLYVSSWAKACENQNQNMKTAYENCLREAKSWTDYVFSHAPELKKDSYIHQTNQCKSFFQFTLQENPNCTLPKSIAESLNSGLNKMELHCRVDV